MPLFSPQQHVQPSSFAPPRLTQANVASNHIQNSMKTLHNDVRQNTVQPRNMQALSAPPSSNISAGLTAKPNLPQHFENVQNIQSE